MIGRTMLAVGIVALGSACAGASKEARSSSPPRIASASGPDTVAAARPASYQPSPPAAQKAADKKDEVRCWTERPTGSNIPKRVCRSVADIERESQRTRDWLILLPKSKSERN